MRTSIMENVQKCEVWIITCMPFSLDGRMYVYYTHEAAVLYRYVYVNFHVQYMCMQSDCVCIYMHICRTKCSPSMLSDLTSGRN